MNDKTSEMKHAELTEKIIGVFYSVYNQLGHGFLESVYEQAMVIALKASGISVARQVAIPVCFQGQQIGDFRADLIVDDAVLRAQGRSTIGLCG
jgi:GxxExxY protein